MAAAQWSRHQAEVRDISSLDPTLVNRILEYSRLAYQREIVTFSDFLNLDQLNTLHSIPKGELYTKHITCGGYDGAERQMVAFYQDALCFGDKRTLSFPYVVISISPVHMKYAQTLTHRDYLGAILNLGIERSKVGDLLVHPDSCYVFIQSSLGEYVTENLSCVKRTSVTVKEIPLCSFSYEPKFTEIKGSIPSLRLDAVLSLALGSSRSKLTGLIQGGKVFVNGRLILSNSHTIKENDVISVRGVGKYKFSSVENMTKKERYYVRILKYS